MPWWHIKTVGLNGSSSLVTVRPQSRILQDNLLCVDLEVAAGMPSLVRKQCQTALGTGDHETGFDLILKSALMRTTFYASTLANIRIHMHAQSSGKFNIKHQK